MATETLMVAAVLKRPEVGQVFDTLPAKMTYASWFQLPDEQREAFASCIEEIIEESRPPRPVVLEEARFGDKVLGFEKVYHLDFFTQGFNPLLDFLPHAALISFISTVDPSFDRKYFGAKWNPHTKGQELSEGQTLSFDNLTVFKKDTHIGKKVVEAVYPWGRP